VLDEEGNPLGGEKNSDQVYVVINSSGVDDYIAESCSCNTVGGQEGSRRGLMAVCLFVLFSLSLVVLRGILPGVR